jgi:hypothetical protein
VERLTIEEEIGKREREIDRERALNEQQNDTHRQKHKKTV